MLEISALEAGYGPIRILAGVSLSVGRGRIVALLGGNGTGKSTLLKAISGLVRPTLGSIIFDGKRIAGLPPHIIVRRGLVQVTQGKEAFAGMTVEENLLLGGFTCPDRVTRARTMDEVYGYFPVLHERRHHLAAVLSGGQLQMLCIAAGLMCRPKMMLLDEPSAALAPRMVQEIFQTIHRISRSGMTVLLVEQNVRMALLLADYGYVIRDGTIHLEGPAESLVNDERVRLSYLGGTIVNRAEAGLPA
jgi:branched-chain amino acid transport system ATP-binding protein